MTDAPPLRLKAEAEDDLPAMSAALQDAVAQLGDLGFEPRAQRFTLLVNRFRWEQATGRRSRGERVRTAVQIGSVLAARSRNLRQGAPDAVVSLLAITFEPGEAPGGALVLTFSGDGELRLTVECVDIIMADVSEPWRARARPRHPDEEDKS